MLDDQGRLEGKKLNLHCSECKNVGNGKDTGFTRLPSDPSKGMDAAVCCHAFVCFCVLPSSGGGKSKMWVG